MASINKRYALGLLNRHASILKYVMMVSTIIVITLALPKHPKFKYEFEKGRVWLHDDLVSPYNYPLKKTPKEVNADKESIKKTILPIYKFNSKIKETQLNQYQTDFEAKWRRANLQNPLLKDKTFRAGLNFLVEVYNKGIIGLHKKYQRDGENYLITLLNNNVETELSTATLLSVSSAFLQANQQFTNDKSIAADILLSLIKDHLTPNVFYDEQFTEKIENRALENVSTTRGMVQKGELIIATGNSIDAEVHKKLESLRISYEQNASINGDRKLVLLGQAMLVTLIIALLMVFLFLFRKDIYADNRQISLILLVITGMLVFLSLAIKIQIPNLYFIPYCIVPIIIRILFDTRLAMNIHLLVVLIASFFLPNSFEFAFLQITAGMVAIYSIKNLVRREQFLLSALLILLNYLVVFIGISLVREGSINTINWVDFVPFIFSVMLTLLAYPLIYLFEKLFGITSDITLMELTNTNNTLLRDLASKAPGTFQHSLQVANLAEAAIYKIGGNTLLVRAGALYHDIGKTENPQFFIENQNKGFNPHDKLSYQESAQIIIRHVSKGIEMARKHNIPEMIVDFIKTHHGNTRVDYFYQSYLKNFPEKIVDENTFRYPGPTPFTKETAVLMMADSVEAASRSLKEPDAKNINDLVERIIDYKLAQDQLDDSNITLHDLEVIKIIFKNMLMSIYHVRIDYSESI